MESRQDFCQGSVAHCILRMAVPMTVAQLVNVLYSITDRFFIGHMGDGASLGLTGVGVVFPIISIITAFTNLFGMGGAPLCSIARGKQETLLAEKIMGTTCFMLLVTAGLLTVLGALLAKPLLFWFGASADTYPYASAYFSVYIWGTPAAMLSLGMNGFVNSQGFGRAGMLTITVGAAANMTLDPLLIYGFGMGIRGAAIATVVSQLLSAVWVMRFLTGPRAILKLRRGLVAWEPALLWKVVRLGFCHFIMSFTNAASQLAYNTALRSMGGDVYIGAMTVINSLREVITMPANGITGGAQPVLGYNYGARAYDRVRQGAICMAGICTVYMLLAWGVVFLFPEALIRFFNDDAELVAVGARLLHIYFFGFCFMALQMSGQAVFTSLGKAGYAIFFSLFRKVGLVIPLIFLLPGFLGIDGVLWSEPISNLIGGTACFLAMVRTVWKVLGKTEEGLPTGGDLES